MCLQLTRLVSSRLNELSSPRLLRQSPTPPGRENAHNPKHNIEQRQRIRHQPAHPTHPSHSAEHPGRAIRAPPDSRGGQEVPEHGIHGDQDADETGEDKRKETVAQYAGRAWKGKGCGEVANDGAVGHGGFVVRVVVGGVGGVGGSHGSVEGGGHETEDEVEGDSAEDGDTVDVAVEDLAGEEEEGSI